jgi:hypothetical protein
MQELEAHLAKARFARRAVEDLAIGDLLPRIPTEYGRFNGSVVIN